MLERGQVLLAAGKKGHTGARKGDLGSGSELEDRVGGAVLFTVLADAGQCRGVGVQAVHCVGVVIHHQELFAGNFFQFGQALHRFFAVNTAGGVGKPGDTPDALDGCVPGNQFFYGIHIWPAFQHGYGNHLDAKVLTNREVAVIAGYRAEELYLV